MTEKNKENKKRGLNLQNKTIRYIEGFALTLIVAVGTLIGIQQWQSALSVYKTTTYNYTRTASEMIDGDKIAKYVETGEKDDHYYSIQAVLDATLDQTDLEYYYVFVPLEDQVLYVWDGTNGTEEPYELGFTEDYMSEESKAATYLIYRKDPPEILNLQRDSKYGFIGSAYSPVFNSAGEPVAVVGADISMPDLSKNVAKYILLVVISIAALTTIALAFFYRTVERNVITPINKLKESTEQMVNNIEGDDEVEIDVHTGDELEELADSITKMDDDLRNYIRELSKVTAEKEKISAELDVATRIQVSALPRIVPPFSDNENFELYATMSPALEVGGDFYDFFMVDDTHIALVMADVSGKGIPASLFMMISKALIKNVVQSGASPGDALAIVNEQLLESNDAGFFVTVWLAIVDLATGHGVEANAGHEHPALKRKDGSFELIKYPHSPAVSIMEGLVYKEREFDLNPGDMFFVYTDGVTEATDADNQLFGEDRLVDSLNSHRDASTEELLPEVREDINAFVGDAPQFDDITMLAFKYNGNNQKGEDVNE